MGLQITQMEEGLQFDGFGGGLLILEGLEPTSPIGGWLTLAEPSIWRVFGGGSPISGGRSHHLCPRPPQIIDAAAQS